MPDPAVHAAPAHPGRPVYLLASFGQRLKAYAIDGLILTVPVLAMWAFVLPLLIDRARDDPRLGREFDAITDGVEHPEFGRILFWIVVFTVVLLACWWLVLTIYTGAFMRRTQGQTPGRRAVGIRVMRADGRPIGFWWSITRTVLVREVLFGVGGLLSGGIVTVTQYLWPLWDHQRRALHDIVARSRVVQDAPAGASAPSHPRGGSGTMEPGPGPTHA